VDVRVVAERLAPGVQHREHADLRPQVPGIGRDLPQRLGGRPEQQVVDQGRVLQGQRPNLVGQREDDVVVLDGQERLGLAFQPGGPLAALALGAMAITTGVVAEQAQAAVVALVDVAAQRGGAAEGQVGQGALLSPG
jgi:hypothetical protein